MPRGKAQFSGQKAVNVSDSIDTNVDKVLRKELERVWRTNIDAAEYDDLLQDIKAAAWLAKRMLVESGHQNTVQDLKAELSKILRWIDRNDFDKLFSNLTSISTDVWWAIRVQGFDPAGATNDIQGFKEAVALASTSEIPSRMRPNEYQHAAALELARRVLECLRGRSMELEITLTTYADNTNESHLVRLLKQLGDVIGLVRETTGWRDIVSRAKNGEDRPTD